MKDDNINIDKLQYIINVRTKEIENINKRIKQGVGNEKFLNDRIKMLEQQISENKSRINNFLNNNN